MFEYGIPSTPQHTDTHLCTRPTTDPCTRPTPTPAPDPLLLDQSLRYLRCSIEENNNNFLRYWFPNKSLDPFKNRDYTCH